MNNKDFLLKKLDWDWFTRNIVKTIKHGYYIQALCPYHDDQKASMSISKQNGAFYCHACGKSGSFIDLICDSIPCSFPEACKLIAGDAYKSKKYSPKKSEAPVEIPLTWNMKQVNTMHAALMNNKEHLNIVHTYGISDYAIEKFRLGVQPEKDCLRLVIPIVSDKGLIAVKLHRITGNPDTKTYSATGSKTFIYPYNTVIKSDQLLLIEGEPDVLCGFSNDIPSLGLYPCTFTGGALTFKIEWVQYFLDKIVYFGYDNDKAGNLGSEKVLTYLDGRADIRIFKMPPGYKDLRDYFVIGKHTAKDFQAHLNKPGVIRQYDQYHPIYIKKRLYPILEESCGDRFKWIGLKSEIDRLFCL